MEKRRKKPTVFLDIELDMLQVLLDEHLFEHRAYCEQSTNVDLLLQCVDMEDGRFCELRALHVNSTGMACISQSCYLRIEKNLSTARELNLATQIFNLLFTSRNQGMRTISDLLSLRNVGNVKRKGV